MDKQSTVVKGKKVNQVRKLNLSGKKLTEIPEFVFEYTNLTKLVLSRNAITRIPKEIAKLKKLEVLDLTYNKLNTLPAPVFNLPKLRVLAVGHNALKKFPTQLKDSHIKELIADHNKIEKIDADSVDGLVKLVISHNPTVGQIITHDLPNLLFYDFRDTKLDAPSKEFLNEDCKGWASGYMDLASLHVSEVDAVKAPSLESGCIFISHSSKDKEIVDCFVDHILVLGMSIQKEKIRCTSIDGLGIPNGEEMRKWIHTNIADCSYAFLMISPSYKSSEICLNEMGAIWALDKPVKIFLWPGADYKNIGWLEEIRQASHINESSELNKLYDDLTNKLGLTKNVTEWGNQKKKFLDLCKKIPGSFEDVNKANTEDRNKIDKIYLDNCDRIFELLLCKKYASWTEMATDSRPRIPIELLINFESLVPFLDSRAKYEGYGTFDRLFEALSLLIDDFVDVFTLYGEDRQSLCQIRAFYREKENNPSYYQDLDDYNAYVAFIGNLVFEFTRLCNALLSEARHIKLDYLPDYGIFAIDGIRHCNNKIVRLEYKDGEIYKGIQDFLDSALTRTYNRPFDKQIVQRVIKDILNK